MGDASSTEWNPPCIEYRIEMRWYPRARVSTWENKWFNVDGELRKKSAGWVLAHGSGQGK
jgi:hypothetical protein